jgi:osmotically-inducible protein OsmY
LAKECATKLVETVKGVRTVVNQLQMIPSQSDFDLAVKQQVVEELRSDPLIEPANFHVKVENGIMTLDGPVNSWHEKFIAGKIVKRVQGVKNLKNKLVRRDMCGIIRKSGHRSPWHIWKLKGLSGRSGSEILI